MLLQNLNRKEVSLIEKKYDKLTKWRRIQDNSELFTSKFERRKKKLSDNEALMF